MRAFGLAISTVVIEPRSSVAAHPVQAVAALGVGRGRRSFESFGYIHELPFERLQFGFFAAGRRPTARSRGAAAEAASLRNLPPGARLSDLGAARGAPLETERVE